MSSITKNALAVSLKKLLESNTLDKITISQIVELCELNRQSFYYHFSNIYDLVSWTLKKDIEKKLQNKVNYKEWQEGFLVVLSYCKENNLMIHNLYHSQGKTIIENALKEYVINLLLRVIEEEIKKFNISVTEEDKLFIANYNMFAFVGMVMLWIDSNMVEEPSTLVDRISILIKGDFEKALSSFSIK